MIVTTSDVRELLDHVLSLDVGEGLVLDFPSTREREIARFSIYGVVSRERAAVRREVRQALERATLEGAGSLGKVLSDAPPAIPYSGITVSRVGDRQLWVGLKRPFTYDTDNPVPEPGRSPAARPRPPRARSNAEESGNEDE